VLQGAAVRRLGIVVPRRQLAHITERLAHARHVRGVRIEVARRGERALVERRRVDVRVLRTRIVASLDRVGPGLLKATGLEKMQ
jgi:hypothetical protein